LAEESVRNRKGGSAIRVKLAGKKNRYASCELEFTNDGIVEILCDNPKQKKDLIELIAGIEPKNGVSILDNMDTLKTPEKYKKNVDIIDPDKIVSTLNVKNYIIFFTMVTGVYHDEIKQELIELFGQIGLQELLDKTVNELSREERIKVRCIASRLKKVKCLIGKDIMEDMNSEQIDKMLRFLRQHICNKKCLCLLFENKKLQEFDAKDVYTV